MDLESNLTIQKAPKKPPIGMPERVKIILDENENIPITGLFLGHNGRGYLLKAGEEVSVPAEILEILDHAIMSVPMVNPQTRQVVGHRDQRRYSYRVLNS